MKIVVVAPWRFAKSSPWLDAVTEYKSRLIAASHQVQLLEPIRQLASSSETDQFLITQAENLHKNRYQLIALDENGKAYNSAQFASLIEKSMSNAPGIAFFCGGAYGLPAALSPWISQSVSLSAMTMAHELAYAVLMEQLFRAHAIICHHPYHHGQVSKFVKP